MQGRVLAQVRCCHGVGHRSPGGSLVDLLGTIQGLDACGVDLYLDQQHIDTMTPVGKLMFQITGAFAEFERCNRRSRGRPFPFPGRVWESFGFRSIALPLSDEVTITLDPVLDAHSSTTASRLTAVRE
jgi:hypothetical protein